MHGTPVRLEGLTLAVRLTSDDREKGAWGDDADALVFLERNQIIVSGDDTRWRDREDGRDGLVVINALPFLIHAASSVRLRDAAIAYANR